MKRFLPMLSVLFVCLTGKAQDIREGYHITNFAITVVECNIHGTNIAPANSVVIRANIKFKVISTVGTDYVIQILTFPSNYTGHAALNLALVRNGPTDRFFKMAITDYNASAVRLNKRGSFTVGASTSLIKIRPGRKELKNGYKIESEFGNDFNIGLSAGWRFTPYRKMDLSHNFMFGLGFTSIKVTPYTTQKFVTSEATQSCVTLSAGYVFEYNKFQVSIFSGIDYMSGEIGRNWIYKNRPWIGLGFGYEIFKTQGSKAQ